MAHHQGESFALALVDRWNSKEKVTLSKLMTMLRKIERLDVLHDLVKDTGFNLPDDENETQKPDDDVPPLKGSVEQDQDGSNPAGQIGDSVISYDGQSSSPVVTMPTPESRRHADVPQCLVYSKFPGQEFSESDQVDRDRVTDAVDLADAVILDEPSETSQRHATRDDTNGSPAVRLTSMPLDRSISVEQGIQPLEPINVECSQSQIEQLQMEESYGTSNVAEPEVRSNPLPGTSAPAIKIYSHQDNTNIVRVHHVQQESQNSGSYIPIGGVGKRPPGRISPMSLDRGEQQAGLDGFQQLQNNVLFALEGPASPHDRCVDEELYIPGDSENASLNSTDDSVNNNSSTRTLSYPPASNCRSIVREGILADISTGSDIKDLRQLKKGFGGQYMPEEVHGETVSMEESLSSFDSSPSEASCCAQISEGSANTNSVEIGKAPENANSEGELTGILRKANKAFPELRAEMLDSCEESGVSQTSSGNWKSLDNITDDDLFGSPTTDCPGVANRSPFQDLLNRGPADTIINPCNATTKEPANSINRVSNDNEKTKEDAKEVSETNGNMSFNSVLLCNSDHSQLPLQSRGPNINLNLGFHETDDIEDNSTIPDSSEDHSSLLQSMLATAYNESDSLPWKQLIGGMAGLTALIYMQCKK